MAQTPEKKVKDRVTRCIKTHGGWEAKPVMQGMGQNGTPDILACISGVFLAVETKSGRGKPTKLQQAQLRKIQQAGGLAVVVSEKTLSSFEKLCAFCQAHIYAPHIKYSIDPALTAPFEKDNEGAQK